MARTKLERAAEGATTRVSVDVTSSQLGYMRLLSNKKAGALTRALVEHATVASILRNPNTTDAQKLSALYLTMPHAVPKQPVIEDE